MSFKLLGVVSRDEAVETVHKGCVRNEREVRRG
jgi:hypothetical protein